MYAYEQEPARMERGAKSPLRGPRSCRRGVQNKHPIASAVNLTSLLRRFMTATRTCTWMVAFYSSWGIFCIDRPIGMYVCKYTVTVTVTVTPW